MCFVFKIDEADKVLVKIWFDGFFLAGSGSSIPESGLELYDSDRVEIHSRLATTLCSFLDASKLSVCDEFMKFICGMYQAGMEAQLAKNKEVMNKLLGS